MKKWLTRIRGVLGMGLTWAVGGLVLGLVPVVAVAEGTATVALAAGIVATVTLLSAVSASGSLMLARMGEDRASLKASDDVAEVGLSGDEAQELLGG